MKIVKVVLLVLVALVALVFIIASPLVIKARMEGEKLFKRYDTYTRDMLSKKLALKDYPVKAEFKKLHPWKALKLMKFIVTSQQGDKLARINSIDATMGIFMKMYTILFRPDYRYNLPMMSVDFIFIGGKRVYVIELIDPAAIPDDNKEKHYETMRTWKPTIDSYEQMDVNMEWCEGMLADTSIHIKSDRTQDDVLFDIYKTYLNAYLDMVASAQEIGAEQSKKVQDGIEGYVGKLLAKGGPAVDVFKKILGPEKQQEYVRTVMFGVE